MTPKYMLAVASLAAAWGTALAQGQTTDLLEAYRSALQNDATYLAAGATLEASRQEVPKARASLLPSLSASGNRSHNTTDNTSPNIYGQTVTRRTEYTYQNYNASLRQPLFRLQSWAQYWQADASVEAAESTYMKEGYGVILRVVQSYFDALLAADQLALARSQRSTFDANLQYAEQSLKLGTGTLTDVQDVKARRDRALAQEIEAENNLEYTRRTLQTVTGLPVDALAPLEPARIDLSPLKPERLEEWLALAETNNPQLNAARSNVDAARQELLKQRAGHLPTVDLVASRQKGANVSNTSLGTEYWTSSVGVEVNIPLISGGYVMAASSQASASLERARQQQEATHRAAQLEVRKQYNNVVQGLSYIRAQEQAVRSAEEAVKGNRKGIQAGTRMMVDLLNAERDLVSARFELARSRHDYVLSLFQLKAMAGTLTLEDIESTNRWLQPVAALK